MQAPESHISPLTSTPASSSAPCLRDVGDADGDRPGRERRELVLVRVGVTTASVRLPVSYSTQSSGASSGSARARAARRRSAPPRRCRVTGTATKSTRSTPITRRSSLRRRVALVQRQRVAVRVGEVGHVADAGVERLAVERDALRLELGSAQRPIVDLEQDDAVRLRLILDAEPCRGPDREAGVADPELVAGVLVRTEPEGVDVEPPRALYVRRRDADDVDLADRARRLTAPSRQSLPSAAG